MSVLSQVKDLQERGVKVDHVTANRMLSLVKEKIKALKQDPEKNEKQLKNLQTLKTSYSALLNPTENGRIYPQYKRSKIFRWNASKPGIQSISKVSFNKSPRFCVLPEEGFNLISFDYEQGEYRVIAEYINNTDLIQKLNEGADFHQLVAEKLNISRDQAKKVNFATFYGQGVNALAEELDTTFDRASNIQHMVISYLGENFEKFKNSLVDKKEFLLRSFEPYKLDGKVYTRFPNVIQATLAGIVENAMIHAKWWIDHSYLTDQIFLYILNHDELIYCCRKGC